MGPMKQTPPNNMSARSAARAESSILRGRKFESLSRRFRASTGSTNYVGERAYPRAVTKRGPRSSWKLAKGLAGDTERQASSGEVKDLHREMGADGEHL